MAPAGLGVEERGVQRFYKRIGISNSCLFPLSLFCGINGGKTFNPKLWNEYTVKFPYYG